MPIRSHKSQIVTGKRRYREKSHAKMVKTDQMEQFMARQRRNAGGGAATHVEAHAVGFFSAKAATPIGGPNMPMLLVSLARQPGVLEHLAFSQEDAIRLIGALAHGLANQDVFLGHALLHVTARSKTAEDACKRPAHTATPSGEKRTLIVKRRPRATRLSDRLVQGSPPLLATHKRAVEAGPSASLQAIFDVEPDVACYIESALRWIFDGFRRVNNPPNIVRAVENDVILLLAAVFTAMRDANYDLWRNTMVGTRLAQIDPNLEKNHRRRKPKAEDAGEGNGS